VKNSDRHVRHIDIENYKGQNKLESLLEKSLTLHSGSSSYKTRSVKFYTEEERKTFLQSRNYVRIDIKALREAVQSFAEKNNLDVTQLYLSVISVNKKTGLMLNHSSVRFSDILEKETLSVELDVKQNPNSNPLYTRDIEISAHITAKPAENAENTVKRPHTRIATTYWKMYVLNPNNTLYEVRKLTEEIRESAEVEKGTSMWCDTAGLSRESESLSDVVMYLCEELYEKYTDSAAKVLDRNLAANMFTCAVSSSVVCMLLNMIIEGSRDEEVRMPKLLENMCAYFGMETDPNVWIENTNLVGVLNSHVEKHVGRKTTLLEMYEVVVPETNTETEQKEHVV